MLGLCIFLAVILVYFVRRNKLKMKYKPVPSYHGWVPLLGHSYLLLGKDQEGMWSLVEKWMRELSKQGGAMSVSFGVYPMTLISDPDATNIILNKCLDKHFLYEMAKPWFKDGLLNADLSTWKIHRKVLSQSFTHQAIAGFFGVFNSQAKQLLTDVQPKIGQSFDPEPTMIKNNLKTTCKTVIGIYPDTNKKILDDYIHAAQNYLSMLLYKYISVYCKFIAFPSFRKKYECMLEKMQNFSSILLRKRKVQLFEPTERELTQTDNFKPILDKMLELSHCEKIFTEDEIQSEMDLILFAGHDTIATTVHFVFLLLGSHPEVQQKVYEEVLEVFGDSDRDLDNVDLTKLVYMECILKETLRLYPAAPIIGRTTSTDIQLKNYTIPAGTPLVISIWAIHRHSLWGDDYEVFRPERWLDPTKAADFSKVFYGFSAGRRGCIGKSYAMLSMKITLAHFIKKYQIRSDINKLKLKFKVLLKPSSGQEITIQLRK